MLLPGLLDGPLSAQLAATLRPPGSRAEPLLWDECVNRLGQARAAAQAGRLAREAVGTDRAAPAGVLRSVAASRGELAAALAGRPGAARSGPGTDSLGLLAGHVYALIAFTMVAGGQARWRAAWGGEAGATGLELVSWDGTDFGTEQLAARAGSFVVDPTGANEGWLLDHLRGLGIDPGEPVDLSGGRKLAPAAAAGTAAGPGDTLVIRPVSEPREVRNDRLLTGTLAGVIGVIAIAVGAGASAGPAAPSYQPPVASFALAPAPVLPSLPDYDPATLLPRTLPSGLLAPEPLPSDLLPAVPAGGITACPPPLQGDKCITISVARGDTLSQLACRYGTTVAALQQVNQLGQSTGIYAGEKLTVPFLPVGPADCGT